MGQLQRITMQSVFPPRLNKRKTAKDNAIKYKQVYSEPTSPHFLLLALHPVPPHRLARTALSLATIYLFQVSAATLLLGTPGFRRLQAYLPQHRCVWSLGEAGLDEARGAVTNTKIIKRVLIFPGYHDLSRDSNSQALVENMIRVTSCSGPV